MNKSHRSEDYYGILPDKAPLAMAYVPMQRSAAIAYDADMAFARGTLFPGLDLPFMGMVNDCFEQTPRIELMTIDFVLDELSLYLDTHSEDHEAFQIYQSFLSLAKEARERYIALFGPVQKCDLAGMKSYNWLADPWPWDYIGKKEGK